MEEKRRNGGYEIIQAVKVTPKTEIVLGENLNNPITPYVVWTCFNETDYQWGHYYGSYLASLADLGTAIQTKALEYKEQLAGRGCKDNKKPFFDEQDCLPDSQQAVYEHQVIVLSPAYLAHVYRHPSQQLYLATSGNGCTPGARGQAVYATSLADGQSAHWERHQVIGILDPEKMPSWAKKSLARIHRLEKKEQPAPGAER